MSSSVLPSLSIFMWECREYIVEFDAIKLLGES